MRILLADLANPDHQQAIVELLDMYCRDAFGDGQPLGDRARQNLIPGLIEHGGARVLLAYDGELPVGVAICLKGFSSFRGGPLLNIHDLAVAPAYRGRGVGRALLQGIEREARQFGGCKLTLEVRSDNARAQALYERSGFHASQPPTWFWSKELESHS
jgi:ribosomal protein S18 acetylase RimI-like enzyme